MLFPTPPQSGRGKGICRQLATRKAAGMQGPVFEVMADDIGWTGEQREAVRLREVDSLGDPQIAAALGLPLAKIRELLAEGDRGIEQWRQDRGLTSAYHEAKQLLGMARNRRRVHASPRTRGEPNTGRGGKGDLARSEGASLDRLERSPYPSAWDFIPEPKDNAAAGIFQEFHRQRLAEEAAQSQANQTRRLVAGELPSTDVKGTLNRAQRRALKRWGQGQESMPEVSPIGDREEGQENG